MSAHTPGPWHRNIKPARKYPVIFAGRNTHVAVVESRGLSDAEVEANCDLITAAPDLLATLKRAEYEIHNPGTNRNDGVDIAEMVRAAIAKAEGRATAKPCPVCNGLGAFPATGLSCDECLGGGEVRS